MEYSLLLMLLAFTNSVIGEGCCKSKVVGGSTYTFTGEEDTSTFSCLDQCIYAKEGEENSKYCFAVGPMQVECKDTGSGEAGSTGGSGGGVAGSTAGDGEVAETTAGAGGVAETAAGAGGVAETTAGGEGVAETAAGGEGVAETTASAVGGAESTAGAGGVTAADKPAATVAGGSGCKCGIKKGSRIVGGTETEVNEYPWMAGIADISDDSSFYCGGTLIASQWVVTASHCLFKNQDGTEPTLANEVQIVLGEHDLSSTTESTIPRKKVTVSKIVTHPSYNALSSSNDIALLKLSEEVDLNVYTPSCVANTGDNFDGKNAWVYGWGTTSFGGVTPNKLLEVEVPIVTNTVCDAAMGEITADKLCAGGELNKDGCQGDSGGPLTVDVSGKHVLVGDVSYGNGCGLAGQYGVYGNVAYLRAWIDTTVAANGGAKYCPS